RKGAGWPLPSYTWFLPRAAGHRGGARLLEVIFTQPSGGGYNDSGGPPATAPAAADHPARGGSGPTAAALSQNVHHYAVEDRIIGRVGDLDGLQAQGVRSDGENVGSVVVVAEREVLCPGPGIRAAQVDVVHRRHRAWRAQFERWLGEQGVH